METLTHCLFGHLHLTKNQAVCSWLGKPIKVKLKMFLKPVWVGKIHGVGVYATNVVRI